MLISYILMRRSNIATDAKRPELALKLANAALDKVDPIFLRVIALSHYANEHMRMRSSTSRTSVQAPLNWLSNSLSEASTQRKTWHSTARLNM